jgi:hypothetical protein
VVQPTSRKLLIRCNSEADGIVRMEEGIFLRRVLRPVYHCIHGAFLLPK